METILADMSDLTKRILAFDAEVNVWTVGDDSSLPDPALNGVDIEPELADLLNDACKHLDDVLVEFAKIEQLMKYRLGK